MTYSNCV